MLQQELAGWQVAVPMWIPWDCQQAQAAELKGVCKERNMIGGGALSAGQVLGLEGPSVKQSNSKP